MRLPIAPTSQWPLLAVLLAGSTAIVALWFVIARPLESDSVQAGGRYVEGVVGQPQRVNPLFAHLNDVDRDLVRLVFAGLTRLGPNGQILPDLAQSWDVSADGRTYTFRLRPDLTWHNGDPLTAADVVFTFSLLADPDLPGDSALAQFWQEVKCQELEVYLLRCQLPEPFAPFLSFTTIGILPKGVLAGVDAQALFAHPFNGTPMGSGPFRLLSLDATRAVLERNPSYHLGAPKIQEIELRFYPDEHAALTALHRQEIMGLLLSPNVGADELNALAAEGDFRLYSANGTTYTLLYLNNVSPLFSDQRLRRAVALAINRDALVAGFLAGRALRADSPISPGTWAADPELEALPYDPAQARQLLEEAGWRQDAASSVRRQGDVELRFPLLTDSDPLRLAMAQEIGRHLLEVGIQAVVTPLAASELVRDALLPRDYEAAIFGWELGYDPDPYPAWHSSQVGPQGRNLANYTSAEADAILERARISTNLSERQVLYYRFQRLFLADVPSLPLYYPIYNYFVHKSVRGITLGTFFDTSARFNNVQEWTVEAKEELIGP